MNDKERLEAGAHALSNYVGDENHYSGDPFKENYEGYEGYDGFDDHFVSDAYSSSESSSYEGYNGLSRTYAEEVQNGRVYLFTVTNLGKTVGGVTTYQPCTFNLHSGYKVLFGAVGQIQEVSLSGLFSNNTTTVEGNVVQTNTIGGDSFYSELVYFSLYNPMHVVGLKVKTNDTDNLEGKIVIQPISPFRKLDNRFIYMSTHKNEQDFKDNEVTIREGFDFNNQTQISMALTAGAAGNLSKMTITLVFGAVLNTAVALSRKRKASKRARNKRR